MYTWTTHDLTQHSTAECSRYVLRVYILPPVNFCWHAVDYILRLSSWHAIGGLQTDWLLPPVSFLGNQTNSTKTIKGSDAPFAPPASKEVPRAALPRLVDHTDPFSPLSSHKNRAQIRAAEKKKKAAAAKGNATHHANGTRKGAGNATHHANGTRRDVGNVAIRIWNEVQCFKKVFRVPMVVAT